MPEGTWGFRISGKVTSDDYRTGLEPGMNEAGDSGEARVLYLVEDGFTYAPSAIVEDSKVGFNVKRHHKSWKRSAMVTDAGWLVHSIHAFSWMIPGEVRVFPVAELEAAKEWIQG